jgi:phosphoribosylaminoimidazolecarboxamide formyltransferase/IMP cyclohydrolase
LKRVERALISVFDKSGIAEFGRGLAEFGVEILSTGSTAKVLSSAGVRVIEVAEMTGFPEMLDGRVKTLHPRVHAGILAQRSRPGQMAEITAHGIGTIDIVVVNLYPFSETIRRAGVSFEEVIENIDIGGPTLIRAAAKNFQDVAVVTDPSGYDEILEELRANDGRLDEAHLFRLAQDAFAHTARYDGQIAQYLSGVEADASDGGYRLPVVGTRPPRLFMSFEKVAEPRYGENPHQMAAFYRWGSESPHGLAAMRQLQGKELSYNNLADLAAAQGLIEEFDEPAVAIIKHTNPCGVAVGRTLSDAYVKAYEADPVSAFGSIIAVNQPLDPATAAEMTKLFVEAVIAPEVEQAAAKILAARENLRVVELAERSAPPGIPSMEFRRIPGGILVQDADRSDELRAGDSKLITSRQPSVEEWRDLWFAWSVCRHVKSNAIVVASEGQTRGIGAGQMSRVDAVRIAVEKAGERARGAALASDAFFPFRDGIDEAARAGIRTIIQPGGSKRDDEVIRAAEDHGISMVLTGIRHFRH